MVSPEAVPFAKTGGLGDVAGALPLALGRLGNRVALVMPCYRGVTATARSSRHQLIVGGRRFDVGYAERDLADRVRAVFVDVPELYDRVAPYGEGGRDYPDNAIRFAVLARAVLEYAASQEGDWQPSVFHAHEWQTGLLPVYLRTMYAGHPVLGEVPVVFTIHNLAFQGLFPRDTLPQLDFGWELFSPEGLEFWGKVSFLKAGINFSDRITTVSPRYAREILTPELGFGFDGVLRARKSILSGILNGIDNSEWNPEADRYLVAPFGRNDLSGKRLNKEALLQTFGFRDAAALDKPLIGLVSRLTDQKGFDLIAATAPVLLKLDATFVLLGSGEARYENFFRRLAAEHPTNLGVKIGFDERLAHLIVGGSDMFLMPSRFEPCGLNQMYGLRYGTVPIVRATGGLADTVANFSETTGNGTGFTFREYAPAALVNTVRRALRIFRQKPADWRTIQLSGMQMDYSWDVSAREYVKVYRSACSRRGGRGGRRKVTNGSS